MRFRAVFPLVFACLASGCATGLVQQVSTMAGGIAGGMLVPGVGHQLGGWLGHKLGEKVLRRVEDAKAPAERRALNEQLQAGPDAPAYVPMGRVWVDETVHDGRMIAGHYDVLPLP